MFAALDWIFVRISFDSIGPALRQRGGVHKRTSREVLHLKPDKPHEVEAVQEERRLLRGAEEPVGGEEGRGLQALRYRREGFDPKQAIRGVKALHQLLSADDETRPQGEGGSKTKGVYDTKPTYR